MSNGFLTSSELINMIKLESLMPTSQNTFTDADLLSMANQEMKIGLVPAILKVHQEYYVKDSTPIPLTPNRLTYPIPYRAVGGKTREVFYLDTNNNLRAMSRISPDDRPYYQNSSFSQANIPFFIQGNEISLVPNNINNPIGAIVFSFFMRPNQLVDESRAATIEAITTTNQIGAITNIQSAANAIITSIAHGLVTGQAVTFSQTNCNPLINGVYVVTVIDTDTFSVPALVTIDGTTGQWAYQTTSYQVDQIPKGFTLGTIYDLMQTNSGHKTYNYDVSAISLDPINKIITFNTADTVPFSISQSFVTGPIVGDYVAFAGECIIPQAPSDLHDVLSQRVVCRVLQALGDQAGYQVAYSKLQEMETNTGMLIDNRVEGSPMKVNNLRGLLRSSRISRRTW